MKAVMIEQFGDVGKLQFAELPRPKLKDYELLVKIHYAAVNPVDWKIREGLLQSRLPHAFPLIPGWDAAGIVTAVGKDIKNFKVGDEVFAYCRKPTVQHGSYAEEIALEEEHVALKPKKLSFAQSAAIPLVGLTAWQALRDIAKLKSGEKVLILGGAGGVGSFAIALANYLGAHVYTTASPANWEYVKKLGAKEIVDYHATDWSAQLRKFAPEGFDVVFDCVGGPSLLEGYNLVRSHGRLVSIVEAIDKPLAEKKQLTASYCFVAPNRKELTEIAQLIDGGKLPALEIREMALADVSKAQELSRGGHCRGKIVLKII
jgi:NADPH2:quinone reductase